MKTTLILLWLIALASPAWACAVCKSNQPEILQGITHGTGPEGSWDYVIVAGMVAVVAGTFVLSVRYLLKPGEQTENHIKRSIINAGIYE